MRWISTKSRNDAEVRGKPADPTPQFPPQNRSKSEKLRQQTPPKLLSSFLHETNEKPARITLKSPLSKLCPRNKGSTRVGKSAASLPTPIPPSFPKSSSRAEDFFSKVRRGKRGRESRHPANRYVIAPLFFILLSSFTSLPNFIFAAIPQALFVLF